MDDNELADELELKIKDAEHNQEAGRDMGDQHTIGYWKSYEAACNEILEKITLRNI